MSGRFDYVKYDQLAEADQKFFKEAFVSLERSLSQHRDGRAKSLALTALEEAYMWIGKMIRDEQISRLGMAELQEGRTNS